MKVKKRSKPAKQAHKTLRKSKVVKTAKLKKTLKKISSVKKIYQIFYDELPDLIRTIDTNGIVLDCNKSFAKSFGYSKKEVIGKSVFDFVADESRQEYEEAFKKWSTKRDAKPGQCWHVRKDGSKFLGLVHANNIYDEDGKMIGSNTIIKDITEIYETRKKLEEDEAQIRKQYEELKRTHEQISQTEQKYRNLYEKSPSMLRSITTDGILTDCNEAYAKTLGYTKEECVGASFYDHTAERSINDLRENLKAWKETHDITRQEIWMKRKDGTIFPALITGASLFDEHGWVIGRTVALTDLTAIYEARKRLEENEASIREQFKELVKLDIAKDEFTSMISHELKTPLTPIMGWCQALKNPKIMGPITQKQSQAIDAIQSNATKLRDLVGEMLDAQLLDLKKMKLDYKEIDVTEMIDFLAKNLQSAMEPKNIQFVNLTTEKISLKSDRSRLEQILNNLIFNAIDFVPSQNGRIEIKAENKNGEVLFMVKDNGIGIPKEKQHNLFKKFYHLDTSFTRKYGGTGLGLAICRGIVDAFSGKIWVDSEAGKGATFYFTHPKDGRHDKFHYNKKLSDEIMKQ